MYGLTKEDIKKTVVVASLATATAFCLYKGWKVGRRIYEDHQIEKMEDEKWEAVERIIADTKKETLKRNEPVEEDSEADDRPTIKTVSDIDEVLADDERFESEGNGSAYDSVVSNALNMYKQKDEEVPGTTMSEEDMKLRYDKDSFEAWEQYVDVNLVGIPKGSETRVVMERLYDQEVILTDGDDTVESNILDMRIDFFGEDSKWVDSSVTLGEIVRFFAGKLDYDLGPEYGGIANWLFELTTRLGLDSENTNEEDFLEEFADEILNHSFSRYDAARDEQLHGIFGLTESEMTPVDSENGDRFMQEYWDFLNICQ